MFICVLAALAIVSGVCIAFECFNIGTIIIQFANSPCTVKHGNISLPIFEYIMKIFNVGGRCCRRNTREIEVSDNYHQSTSHDFITQETPPPSYGTATANDTNLQEPK